jgi:hypothetical protein
MRPKAKMSYGAALGVVLMGFFYLIMWRNQPFENPFVRRDSNSKSNTEHSVGGGDIKNEL